ncbi:PTS sorbitol transporter subunit IIA [Orenia metallireducens]|uniref:PTS sorbitol transporter subunit IIA n=1 Tax=Orenia metallireducens TaxID=1413210 RepID=A0A1C0A5K1_9FIRM|nr:PTS glucitol/sorbitol transporter subunit IIA [Orenia metallireducens]OCL25389.1 PTS sorbitol transporter subunit IIA [Orenia metallireducens]
MEKIYETNVTDLGAQFEEFLSGKMIILFMDNAPDELQEYCVLHGKNQLNQDIKVGDMLKISDMEYEITAVGDVVNENLANLGHITLKFDGDTTAELAGSLHMEAKEMPSIDIGDIIEIFRK